MYVLTCSRLVLMRLSVHCLATSLASLVTSSEALAMSLAHWIIARLFPLPPRTSRDISAISRAIRLAAAMMSLPCEESGGGWGGSSKCRVLERSIALDKRWECNGDILVESCFHTFFWLHFKCRTQKILLSNNKRMLVLCMNEFRLQKQNRHYVNKQKAACSDRAS